MIVFLLLLFLSFDLSRHHSSSSAKTNVSCGFRLCSMKKAIDTIINNQQKNTNISTTTITTTTRTAAKAPKECYGLSNIFFLWFIIRCSQSEKMPLFRHRRLMTFIEFSLTLLLNEPFPDGGAKVKFISGSFGIPFEKDSLIADERNQINKLNESKKE